MAKLLPKRPYIGLLIIEAIFQGNINDAHVGMNQFVDTGGKLPRMNVVHQRFAG